MSFRILVFRWAQREGTSWRQFIGANFEPFVIYNFSMRRQKNLKLLSQVRVVFTDLGFGVELSLSPHGKVSKCFAVAIYVKNSLRSNFPHVVPKALHFWVGVRETIPVCSWTNQIFWNSNSRNVYASTYMLSPRLMLWSSTSSEQRL